jgi:hypothetical protein
MDGTYFEPDPKTTVIPAKAKVAFHATGGKSVDSAFARTTGRGSVQP